MSSQINIKHFSHPTAPGNGGGSSGVKVPGQCRLPGSKALTPWVRELPAGLPHSSTTSTPSDGGRAGGPRSWTSGVMGAPPVPTTPSNGGSPSEVAVARRQDSMPSSRLNLARPAALATANPAVVMAGLVSSDPLHPSHPTHPTHFPSPGGAARVTNSGSPGSHYGDHLGKVKPSIVPPSGNPSNIPTHSPILPTRSFYSPLFALPVPPSSKCKFASTDIRQRSDPVEELSGEQIIALLKTGEWKHPCKWCPLCSSGKGVCLGLVCLGSKPKKDVKVS